jgi:hypothetical protein
MRIEVLLPPKDLGRNLVFLRRCAGVIQRKGREIAKQLAEGFRAMESMAAEDFFDLPEMLSSLSHRVHRDAL